ncbi:uncharacterized protein PHACADRAFT_85896, partial [Phanerochaete carnosa HHB-10118-sp]
LYPPPSAHISTQQGDGKTKIEFFCLVANDFFLSHSIYGPTYRALKEKCEKATSAKERRAAQQVLKKWGFKIKNRMRDVGEIIQGHCNALGETGVGIKSREEIDMSQKNQFTSLWGMYLPKIVQII